MVLHVFIIINIFVKNIIMKNKIKFAEFLDIQSKLEITTGKVIQVEEVPKSDKLIKLTVDFNNEDIRSVVTNIKPLLGENFKEKLLSKSFLFVTNLEPVKMMGVESTAMIMPGELEKDLLVDVTLSGVKLL